MKLVERDGFLSILHSKFETVSESEGHCVFVSGEAGIGKTALINAFCKEVKDSCAIYQGSCDALFTPRPLAPLYDILLQLGNGLPENDSDLADRSAFFTRILHGLDNQRTTSLVIFEDIHWADEATLDFIKFLARRITKLRCLFILTFRDNEIHSGHRLRNVLGQLNPDSFTRIQVLPLSREAVEKMAEEKGYNGEDVYNISGGNPFYVNEILASYSTGIPDNIKDSILSVYNRMDEKTKHVWQILSVLPTGIEINYLEKMEPLYVGAIDQCLDSGVLILNKGVLHFKHELYRRTIEASLSPLVRICYNKKILDLFMESFEQNKEIERIIHHAKNANEYEVVVRYAPLAAVQAAAVGAHIEASRLYQSAVEYYQGDDPDTLIRFYESYAYECYLTNQIKEAIIYKTRSLELWKKKNDIEKIGNCMWFLSRLWWFEGNRKQAERFGAKAIEILDKQPSSRAKAMAYSNMAQLKFLSDQTEECIYWGEKAIANAREVNDEETVAHALNTMGGALMLIQSSMQKGIELLQQSLEIALRNSYHEHVARAYTNIFYRSVIMKDYGFAKKKLAEGLQYCEERDLNSWASYMLCWNARLNLETGNWNEAYCLADSLLKNECQPPIIRIGALTVLATIKIRRGDADALSLLLEAKIMAFEMMELQRIIPVLSALLEYEWITGNSCIEKEALDQAITMIGQTENDFESNEFACWLRKTRKQRLELKETAEGYDLSSETRALKAAAIWEKTGYPYLQALALFEGSDDDKREAITMVHELGALAVYEKMKQAMRTSGIKKIPRGLRESTKTNPAQLTNRELDVLQMLKKGIQNKEIARGLFISPKTVDHHISAILFKLDVNSRTKAVAEAFRLGILK